MVTEGNTGCSAAPRTHHETEVMRCTDVKNRRFKEGKKALRSSFQDPNVRDARSRHGCAVALRGAISDMCCITPCAPMVQGAMFGKESKSFVGYS